MSEKNDRKNAKLGIFVLVSLILFLIGIFFIGNARDLFNPTIEIHTAFKDVGGLTRGNNVWLSGVKIGTVREVRIASDSIVAVTLGIRENDRRFINEDALATIGSDGLIGNTIVVIKPGQMRDPIDDGDTIASFSEASAQDIMNMLEETGQNALIITEELQEIARQINSGEGTIGRLLKSPELAESLEETVISLEKTGERTAYIAGEVGQMVNRLQKNEQGPVYTLLNDTTFGTTYDSLLANVRVTTDNAAEVSRKLDRLTEKLDDEGNALNVLLADTVFADDLQRTINNAAEGTKTINESVEALQNHWLFGGVFRKNKKEEKRAREREAEELEELEEED
ncbi:MlaD family protein [Nafulsella turpanensis]|uniref:MlaD family protein n=1 Tax=Nafulsella turpanensis TaxID=1265690 RepID=UPI00034D154B|nr:MlaD family protein [Nafulsella turpanensis]